MSRRNRRNRGLSPTPPPPQTPGPIQPPEHPLLTQRMGGTLGLIGLAIAGAALMPADYYVTGSLVSVSALAAAVWLWWPEYRAWRFWRDTETTVATFAILLAAVVVAILVFNRPSPLAGKSSRYEIVGIAPVTASRNSSIPIILKGGVYGFNIYARNTGDISYQMASETAKSVFSAAPLSPQQIAAHLDSLDIAARKTADTLPNSTFSVSPGAPPDFFTGHATGITPEHVSEVLANRGSLYIFVVAYYHDAALRSGFRRTRYCVYFFGNFEHTVSVFNDFDTVP